jgi:hypothetical protein
VRRLVLFVIVLIALLVGLDRLALVAAERGVATAIQQSQDLDTQPDVQIAGFPLLTQALRGRYEQVDTTIDDLTAVEGVRIDELQVRLRDVELPLSAVTRQRIDRIDVGSASATGTVSYASLDQAARQQAALRGFELHFGQGGHGRLAISGTYTAAGVQPVKLDGEAKLAIRGRSLVVTPVASTLDEVPAVLRSRVLALIGARYPLPDLPFGFTPKQVSVGATGVTVRVSADDVVLQGS